MLEPQSTALFIMLMVAFCGLLAWAVLSRQMVFRILAASLAFIPAMLFGVAAVNKYYDYYLTWGSVAADFGAQGVSNGPTVTAGSSRRETAAILNKVTRASAASQSGETIRFLVRGRASHLTRVSYVYLPPQYFRPAYRGYRFPVIELITGVPGAPQDWINVAGITQTYLTLLQDGAVKPAALVMPDANGGRRNSLQCLNVAHGPQDATFLTRDVPRYLGAVLRLQPRGPAWGIAGYSEGGFCAANLALTHLRDYGFAGVLSGYFKPDWDRFGNRSFNPFRGKPRLRRENTPLDRLRSLPVTALVPQFWLGAGSRAPADDIAVRAFQRALLTRQPDTPVHYAPGGGHTMLTWRDLIPAMLEWMTPQLAHSAGLGVSASVLHHGKAALSQLPRPAPSSSRRRPPAVSSDPGRRRL